METGIDQRYSRLECKGYTHLNQLTEDVDAGNQFVEFSMAFDFELCQTVDLRTEIVLRIQNNAVDAARTDDDVQEVE